MKSIPICIFLLLGTTLGLPSPRPRPRFHRGSNVGQKIVGGHEVDPPHSIPWQISLQDKSWENWHFCGGSLISDRYVLTAAHCCDGQIIENMQVVAGEHDLYSNEGVEQAVNVLQMIIHPEYDSYTIENDICLVYTSTAFQLNAKVARVSLPAQDQEWSAGTTVTVSGWGTLSEGGPSPDTLQSVDVPTVSDAECREAYGEGDITDSMLCAGEAGKDSCQGDSGGPLTYNSIQLGIVSFGYGCGQDGFPGVYTEVASFIEWIDQKI